MNNPQPTQQQQGTNPPSTDLDWIVRKTTVFKKQALPIEVIARIFQVTWKIDPAMIPPMGLQTWGWLYHVELFTVEQSCLHPTSIEIPASMVKPLTPAKQINASPALQSVLAVWPMTNPTAKLVSISTREYTWRFFRIRKEAGLPTLGVDALRKNGTTARVWYPCAEPPYVSGTSLAYSYENARLWEATFHHLTLAKILNFQPTAEMIPPLVSMPMTKIRNGKGVLGAEQPSA